MSDPYDVVIVGGGGAAEAMMGVFAEADADLAVAVVESHRVGGECPFTACVPSKVMLHDLEVGRSWAESVRRRHEKVDHLDDAEHAATLGEQGATLLRGRGRLDGPGTVVVDLDDGSRRTLTTKHVVLATGGAERQLEVPGIDEVEQWVSHDLWTTMRRPASVVVVGAGAVGLEAATALAGFGARVDLVHRHRTLLGGSPSRLGHLLADHLEEQGVHVHHDTEVAAVEEGPDGGVRVRLGDGTRLAAERLLLAIGKEPALDGLGLGSIGLEPEAGGALDVGADGRVRGAERLWAIGDVSGHPGFTHTANALGEVAGRNLLDGGDRTVDFRHTPKVIFTSPPSVLVGEFHDDDDHVTVEAGYDELGRPFTDGTGPGAAALCARRDDGLVVGIAGVGETLDEVSAAWALALHARYSASDLAEVMQQFPTHSEVTRLLAGRARAALG